MRAVDTNEGRPDDIPTALRQRTRGAVGIQAEIGLVTARSRAAWARRRRLRLKAGVA